MPKRTKFSLLFFFFSSNYRQTKRRNGVSAICAIACDQFLVSFYFSLYRSSLLHLFSSFSDFAFCGEEGDDGCDVGRRSVKAGCEDESSNIA